MGMNIVIGLHSRVLVLEAIHKLPNLIRGGRGWLVLKGVTESDILLSPLTSLFFDPGLLVVGRERDAGVQPGRCRRLVAQEQGVS